MYAYRFALLTENSLWLYHREYYPLLPLYQAILDEFKENGFASISTIKLALVGCASTFLEEKR